MVVFIEIAATLSPELAALLKGDSSAEKKRAFSGLMRALGEDLSAVHLKCHKKNVQVVADWDLFCKLQEVLQSWMAAQTNVKIESNDDEGRATINDEMCEEDVSNGNVLVEGQHLEIGGFVESGILKAETDIKGHRGPNVDEVEDIVSNRTHDEDILEVTPLHFDEGHTIGEPLAPSKLCKLGQSQISPETSVSEQGGRRETRFESDDDHSPHGSIEEQVDSEYIPEDELTSSDNDDESDCDVLGESARDSSKECEKSGHNKTTKGGQKCSFCGEIYTSVAMCTHHKTKEHLAQYLTQMQKRFCVKQPSNKQCCPECFVLVDNLSLLEEHFIQLHRKEDAPDEMAANEAFKCSVCVFSSPDRKQLREHCQRMHWTKQFGCSYCKKLFGTKRYVNDHIRTSHKVTKVGSHKCQFCGEIFPSLAMCRYHKAKEHLSQYLPRMQKRFCIKQPSNKQCCPECFLLVDNLSLLEEHFVEFHRKDDAPSDMAAKEAFKCSVCVYSSPNRKQLREHCQRKHWTKQFECSYCKKLFGTKRYLNDHLRTSHNADFVCHICGEIRKGKHNLKKHVANVHGEGLKGKPKQKRIPQELCGICGKVFLRKVELKDHYSRHNDKKDYKCPTCGMEFYLQSTLRGHIRLKHKTEKGHFRCESCEKVFDTRQRLKAHMKVVHMSKTHTCKQCGKAFANIQCLERHIRIHTGVKPYACSFCDKAFNDSSILRRHLIGVHKKTDATPCKMPEAFRK